MSYSSGLGQLEPNEPRWWMLYENRSTIPGKGADFRGWLWATPGDVTFLNAHYQQCSMVLNMPRYYLARYQ